ncbi:phosphopentomutase [Natronogracilivirga saccharolytica]|uniref:Phosphopentomutase n=1 Tax=Natronogracilivirga saccharolytica TaxID=2812953 RepID=A0A8J7S593_9BACT|nr:phosphopentomutase [Natronogracilivirga saccharolytica]MBP3192238.1 phosphopentomutase [Natronogracilivirga saccharolytica]
MGSCYLIIIDGLGVGAQEDAHLYGDAGSNTLGHVVARSRCRLPEFERMGLGNIIPLDTVAPVWEPLAAFGKMREASSGKDSTTGHWEIAGLQLERPFPTYENGFPDDVIENFCSLTGLGGVLANKPASGTAVIEEYGEEHQKTGLPIVYTSADSVFQIACDVDTVPLETLYDWCEIARKKVMVDEHAVGRVIARPFAGKPGSFRRLSDQRHDYSLKPFEPFLPGYLQEKGIETWSVGKVIDLFAECGFDHSRRTKSNAEGIELLLEVMELNNRGFVFVNLIETDQNFGHRNDIEGFAQALEEIDREVPRILKKLKPDDLLIITGDHGNDPAMPSTDHSREFTPLLIYPGNKATTMELPIRNSFSDIAVSVCDFYGLENPFPGKSFLNKQHI